MVSNEARRLAPVSGDGRAGGGKRRSTWISERTFGSLLRTRSPRRAARLSITSAKLRPAYSLTSTLPTPRGRDDTWLLRLPVPTGHLSDAPDEEKRRPALPQPVQGRPHST